MVKMISIIYIEMNQDGVIKALNSFMEDDIEYSPDELRRKNWIEVFTVAETAKTVRKRLHYSIFDRTKLSPCLD
jgi:hypothetical protein